MFTWSLLLLGSLVCLTAANPVASGPRVILRGGSVDARSMRLLMNAHPRGVGEIRPECVLNPAAMGMTMEGDSPDLYPDNEQMLVDEETDERVLPETPEENAVPAEGDNSLPELPEERAREPEETTHEEETSEQTTQAEQEGTTVETPTATTEQPDEVESTPEITEETSTHHEEDSTTTEAAEEHSEQPDEENANPEAETPEEEPKAAEEPAPREEPDSKNCGKATPGSNRRSKAHRPVEEDGEDEEEAPRKGGRGGSVYKDFFPVTFGGSGPSRGRDTEEEAGGRGNGPVTAIANSFSQGRGAIASSSAVAHGSPDAGQYRHGRRSRYRL